MTRPNRQNIYLPDHLRDYVSGHPSLSGRISTILDRYQEMLRRTRIERRFTDAEMQAMRTTCAGWIAEPAATVFGGVAMEIEDAGGLGIDKPALLAKLAVVWTGSDGCYVKANANTEAMQAVFDAAAAVNAWDKQDIDELADLLTAYQGACDEAEFDVQHGGVDMASLPSADFPADIDPRLLGRAARFAAKNLDRTPCARLTVPWPPSAARASCSCTGC